MPIAQLTPPGPAQPTIFFLAQRQVVPARKRHPADAKTSFVPEFGAKECEKALFGLVMGNRPDTWMHAHINLHAFMQGTYRMPAFRVWASPPPFAPIAHNCSAMDQQDGDRRPFTPRITKKAQQLVREAPAEDLMYRKVPPGLRH